MDEPFGALDEQTRMILGEDLSVLLARTEKTIVFVTHSLGEAVFLADRVAVFSARPGTIKKIIRVDEPHPRKPELRHLGEIHRAAQRALCAAARRDPQGGGGSGAGPRRRRRSRMMARRGDRARAARQPGGADRLSARLCSFFGISRPTSGASIACCCRTRSRYGASSSTCCRSGAYLPDLRVTATEFAVAFVLATTSGTVVGYFVSRSRYLIRVFEPLFAGIFSIPIILFLPLYVLFFGLGPESKIALGATISFFPIVLATIAGFSNVDPHARHRGAVDGRLGLSAVSLRAAARRPCR